MSGIEKVVFDAERCGTGDVILHAWHGQWYKENGIPCEFYTRRADRLEMLKMLGMTPTSDPANAIPTGGNAPHYHYELRVDRGKTGRAVLWGQHLPHSPKPVRPQVTIRDDEQRRVDEWVASACPSTPLVLLFPFSCFKTRQWPLKYFSDVAWALHGNGYYVVAMGADSSHADALSGFPYYFYGTSWNHVAAMMKRAEFCIGNDSGPAHLAGTMDVAFNAIMGPTKSIFSHTPSVYEIAATPDESACVGCFFNPDKGYRITCDYGCSSLMAVRPEMIVQLVQDAQRVSEWAARVSTNNA